MHRLLLGQEMDEIAKELRVQRVYLDTIANSPLFKSELARQRTVSLQAVTERIEGYAHEALDKIIETMRGAKNEAVRLNAALQVLDRCGYVKVDKTLSVVADAEKIIKELGKIKTEVTIVPIGPIGNEIVTSSTNDHGRTDVSSQAKSLEHGKDGVSVDDRRSGHKEPDQTVPKPSVA